MASVDGRSAIHPDSAFGQKIAAQNHRNKAYDERDEVISALSKQFTAHLMRDESRMNWKDLVCVHLPTGNVAWRISAESRRKHFAHLHEVANHFQRTTHAERTDRLLTLK